MNIFPSIIAGLLALLITLPVGSNLLGFGAASVPNFSATKQSTCSKGQKDKYGRCPYSGSSGFRTFSTFSGGGGGGFGGTK